MKSVVVEGSTVAKAVQAAWLKADRPEEFFIRVLQEHSSGFLGFGAQKAKIVLFFKNTHKSDTGFPTVLQQKEYTNLFDNKHLKNPTQHDAIDEQLNKHVGFGQQAHKQKSYHQQGQNKSGQGAKPVSTQPHADQQKSKQVSQQQAGSFSASELGRTGQGVTKQSAQHKPVQGAVDEKVNSLKSQIQQPAPKSEQMYLSDVSGETQRAKSQVLHEQRPKKHQEKQVASQGVQPKAVQIHQNKPVQQESHKKIEKAQTDSSGRNVRRSLQVQEGSLIEAKTEVVQEVAQALQKVQSQKIVSSISRTAQVQQQQKERPKVVTPKFESYAEFMDAQADKVAAKSQAVVEAKIEPLNEKLAASIDSIAEKIESLQLQAPVFSSIVKEQGSSVVQEQTVVQTVSTSVQEKAGDKMSALPRPFVKMKRRPLSTDNAGVSGIQSVQKEVSKAESQEVSVSAASTNDVEK